MYNELSKHFELTVIHSGEDSDVKIFFKRIKLNSRKVGPFNIQRNLISTVRRESPNFIIMMFDISWPISFFYYLDLKRKLYGGDLTREEVKLV